MSTYKTYANFGLLGYLEIEVEYTFDPGERQTWDCPGSLPSVELDKIKIITEDHPLLNIPLEMVLDPVEYNALGDEVLEYALENYIPDPVRRQRFIETTNE